MPVVALVSFRGLSASLFLDVGGKLLCSVFSALDSGSGQEKQCKYTASSRGFCSSVLHVIGEWIVVPTCPQKWDPEYNDPCPDILNPQTATSAPGSQAKRHSSLAVSRLSFHPTTHVKDRVGTEQELRGSEVKEQGYKGWHR